MLDNDDNRAEQNHVIVMDTIQENEVHLFKEHVAVQICCHVIRECHHNSVRILMLVE